jgi:hypothetical protein
MSVVPRPPRGCQSTRLAADRLEPISSWFGCRRRRRIPGPRESRAARRILATEGGVGRAVRSPSCTIQFHTTRRRPMGHPSEDPGSCPRIALRGSAEDPRRRASIQARRTVVSGTRTAKLGRRSECRIARHRGRIRPQRHPSPCSERREARAMGRSSESAPSDPSRDRRAKDHRALRRLKRHRRARSVADPGAARLEQKREPLRVTAQPRERSGPTLREEGEAQRERGEAMERLFAPCRPPGATGGVSFYTLKRKEPESIGSRALHDASKLTTASSPSSRPWPCPGRPSSLPASGRTCGSRSATSGRRDP